MPEDTFLLYCSKEETSLRVNGGGGAEARVEVGLNCCYWVRVSDITGGQLLLVDWQREDDSETYTVKKG